MARQQILFLLAFYSVFAGSAGAQTKWRQVSDFHFVWNNQPDVHVTLEIPFRTDSPGDYTRISIQVPGHTEFTLRNSESWVKYKSDAASASPQILAKKNMIPSEYVLALQAATGRTLLFLLGYSYASSPGRLDVLELTTAGDPRVVLHREEFGLKDVRDLDQSGLSAVIGYPCLSEDVGNALATYDPFNVYRLAAAPGDRAALSIPLSRSYNMRHYYGWAGPECSEKMAVVLHPPGGGKPLITSVGNAEKMTANQH